MVFAVVLLTLVTDVSIQRQKTLTRHLHVFSTRNTSTFLSGVHNPERSNRKKIAVYWASPVPRTVAGGYQSQPTTAKKNFIGVCGKQIQFKKFSATLEHMNLDYIFICILG